ncbi:putative Ig domain-containing protein [Oceanicoccus sp. KOV_DT_Chl]|uniref:putative Ig domain-containing protein n=1 Tax=Oceanicoccus sp. KOV_DT_Chl TaxID=1904639 RepID=UPI000C7AF45B|nr:putative Ig domain-containing protein [Oceanicoccus sp. KOV_DT_Chl]
MTVSQFGSVVWDTSSAEIGDYNTVIYIEDVENTVSQSFVVSVIEPPTVELVITSIPATRASTISGYQYFPETTYPDDEVTYEIVAGPEGVSLLGGEIFWRPISTENTLEEDTRLQSCINYDDFVIGAYGAFSLYIESFYDSVRFPTLYEVISPTVSDTSDIDNQISLGTLARIAAGEKWGFDNTFEYTTAAPSWSGVLTRLVVPDAQGGDLGFSKGSNFYSRPRANDEERALAFHNDTWAARRSHNVCESENNFGVITGQQNNSWEACVYNDWGEYGVTNELPQASLWLADLAIVDAYVENSRVVKFDLSNRGLVATGAFAVRVYEEVNNAYQVIGQVDVAGLSGTSSYSVDVGRPITGNVRIQIDYNNSVALECDTSNQALDLYYFKLLARSALGVITTQDFWVAGDNDHLEVSNDFPEKIYDGSVYIYHAEVFGGDGNYVYELIGAPNGATVNAEGEVRWQTMDTDVGQHIFTLSVADGSGQDVVKTAAVTVLDLPDNQKPVVVSVPPIDAFVGEEYVYQLEVVDPDGDEITILTEGDSTEPGAFQIDENYRITWTPTIETYEWVQLREGYSTLVIEMIDSNGAVTIHNWGVNIYLQSNNDNSPLVSAIDSVALAVNQNFEISVDATNPLGDTLLYSLSTAPDGMIINEVGVVSWAPGELSVGYHEVVVQVSNSEESSTVSFFIEVVPSLSITSSPSAVTYDSELYHYRVVAVGKVIGYELSAAPVGMNITDTGHITWVPTAEDVGVHAVLLSVKDNQGIEFSQGFELTVYASNSLQVTSSPAINAYFGQGYYYQVTAHNYRDDRLNYSLDIMPDGMELSSEGLITWVPSLSQVGNHNVVLNIDDGVNAVAQNFTITVAAEIAVNTAPSISSSPSRQLSAGQFYTYQLIATDEDGDLLTYTLDSAPTAMSIGSTGLISWQSSLDEVGDKTIVVSVLDGRGGYAQQSYSLSVYAETGPVFTSKPSNVAIIGSVYQYLINAVDLENDPVCYSLVSNTEGVSLDGNALTWVPASEQLGVQAISVEATDGKLSTIQNFSVLVTVDQAPLIISDAPLTALVDQLYSYQIQAFDPEGGSLNYQLLGAPGTMTLADSGLIEWQPAAVELGRHLISLRISDAQGSSTVYEFAIFVIEDEFSPVITSDAITSTKTEEGYSYQLTVTDPQGDTINYQLVTAPDSMTIDDVGLVSWSPTVENIGVHSVEIEVSDSDGNSDQQFYQLVVTAPGPWNRRLCQ